jgi:AcrR family transcriptional regulator
MRAQAERSTRERILDVAEASLGQRGYHGTRLHEIAERVGIQKASLFHYFPSKDDLYRAVLDASMVETEQAIRGVLEAEIPPREKLRQLVASYVEMVATHPARTKILLRQSLGEVPNGYRPADAERLLRLLVSFIVDGQRAGMFAPMDPLGLLLSIVGMVAFFFTSVPVFAPEWLPDATSPAAVEQVKRHVIDIVERCLLPAPVATPRAAAG